MDKRNFLFLLTTFFILALTFNAGPAFGQDEETLGEKCEKAERPEEALIHYINALEEVEKENYEI